jgi:hypothetical protein
MCCGGEAGGVGGRFLLTHGSQRMTCVAFCARYEIMSLDTGSWMKWSKAAWFSAARFGE